MTRPRAASLAIAPLQQVARTAGVLDATLWRALGETPQLVADASGARLQGVTRFELDLEPIDGCTGAPVITFDFGQGFDEASAVALERPKGSSRPYAATTTLASAPQRIRLDPCAGRGYFLCAGLHVVADVHDTERMPARVGAIVHLTGAGYWPQMAQYLSHIAALARLYACIPEDGDAGLAEAILAAHPGAVVRRLAADENGAVAVLQMIDLARTDGIDIACLVHTRPSAHVQGLEAGRLDMTHKLLGSPAIVAGILEAFRDDSHLGVVAPAGHVLPFAHARGSDTARTDDWRARLGFRAAIAGEDFLAGAMLWARLDALAPLGRLGLGEADLRASDPAGTGSAIERSAADAAAMRGFHARETTLADTAPTTALDFASPAALDAALARDPGTAPAAPAFAATLVPLRGLEARDAAKGEWRATDNDPQFLVEGLAGLGGQWALARLRLKAPFAAQQPTIYFDFGSGWTYASAAALARPSPEGVSETVCFLPPGVLRARLDPVASPGPFAIGSLDFVPLTAVQATEQMWWALRRAREPRLLLSLDRLFPQYAGMLARFDDSYGHWIRQYEVPRERYRELAAAQAKWADPPLISLAFPAGADAALRDSVKAQVYTHWELLEGDDALSRARGSLFAVLEAGSLLHPLALHYVAAAAIADPGCALVYTDEDRIGADGVRHDPLFKCEVNPELLLACDMIGGLACYRTKLVRELGGARGYDLALRVCAASPAEALIHVPRVLRHRRDDAPAEDAKAARAAVAAHLARTSERGEVLEAPGAPGMQRVRFALPEPAPTVAIVIPTRDRADLLRNCVDSILARTTYPAYSIVIVDNGSREAATRELLDSYRARGVAVRRDDSAFNFSALNNRAVASVSADFVCLVNNDIVIETPGWLEEMVSIAARTGVGAVGARLWYPDRRVQHAGLLLGIAGFAGYAHKLLPEGEPGYANRAVLHQAFSAVTAACLLVKRSVYTQVGGLDERLPVAFNDVDFCLRLREAGYRNVWTPYAQMVHDESSSRGAESTPHKARRLHGEMEFMRSRWGERLYADPSYSPNLTLDAEDFSLAWPPRVTL